MEEVGAQVAAPIFIHQALSTRYCDMTSMAKKHELSYQSPNSQLQQHQFLQTSREKNWNSKAWDWDSVGFVAKPSVAAETLRLGTVSRELKKKDKSDSKNKSNSVSEDDDGLGLNLGGSLTSVEEPASRPSKRVRSGSPGNGSYPTCQVDNCKEDLTKAKDYHRRHKVCEVHSKATKALVGKQMQRFCQQCSRFHPLTEFDEGKRSCRRRLAGHNRRRRKTQPEDVTSRLLLPGNRDMNNNGNLDIVNLLTALARSQASAPDALAILSQRSSQSSDSDKSKLPGPNQVTVPHLQKRSNFDFPAVGVERISHCYESPAEDSDYQIQESRPNLPLQLFSSSPENESRQKPASPGKYFSSDSSNPIEERSPSSSPPVVQKLFPLQSTAETMKSEKMSVSREVNANVGGGRSHGSVLPLELFRGPNREPDHSSFQSFPYQGGYTSSSGSDHSPSSQNSDPQDRTGRIIFKLFDKDPSHFPGTLRTKIYNWLSNSPSDMESYIRPGCVVLSVYLSMPSASWEQLERNLLQLVDSLVQDSDSDLWKSGRFLLNTGRQLASHKDGKVRLCKSWRTWSSPELILVSPVAVISGQETSLQLKGRNLTGLGTKIHCTYMGGYTSKEVTDSSSPGSMYDEINVGGFKIHGPSPSILGRCFIEVENGFKGNSFPVIIADASICKELRLLESEFDEKVLVSNIVSEEQARDFGRPRSREEVMHFLNELGWLFQRKSMPSMHEVPDYSVNRFKFLLIFSVERDYCVLVKTILDMLVERNTCRDELSKEHLEMLHEIQLLNRSVKRRCRKMADLLIHYYIISGDNSSRTYIFPPNVGGPGGITPLHLAACASGSDGLVDALTNDPHEIGLSCWNSVLDANGLSPYAYAVMTKNHSHNLLVARKLAGKRNGQISVAIGNEIEQAALEQEPMTISHFQHERKSCAKCASVAAEIHGRFLGSQGLLQRPYIHSMLAIAAVCVCVCLFFRGAPDIGLVAPFKWENLNYGTI
ncbi:PREDICTED: squamosa promoter-binding-like protein 14 isoform X2 [Populus euphratica]|uniref:Squamosa promoter-binding-like protein 14 isoform X2 n=1 Tax=Populus euphratica TaxID=75702 RepID=A0AAJ6USY9_POPEU|nr:PREDICTED: squamosa promoter-binding-like protein 14 isoform X2 [Populus euphratica]